MKEKFKNVFNIVKKELDKLFRNPKAIFTTLIMPGLLIFLIYSAMGSFMSTDSSKQKDVELKVAIVNGSDVFDTVKNKTIVTQKLNMKFHDADFGEVSLEAINNKESKVYKQIMQDIENQKYNAYIYFAPNFDSQYGNATPPTAIVFGKNEIDNSAKAVQLLNGMLSAMQNKFVVQTVDFTSQSEIVNSVVNAMVPMLLIIFIFAGGLAIGCDSIAGEKERGTIATMLMAPISKAEIIFGKILSVVTITILSAIGPFVGIILSMPKMMSGLDMSGGYHITGSQIGQIFVLILLTALIASAIYLVVSTLAKNVKEATTLASPVYMLAIIVSVLGSSLTFNLANLGYFAVPFLNLSLCIQMAFENTLTTVPFLITIFSNLAYFGIILVAVVKLFKSEKVMFSK